MKLIKKISLFFKLVSKHYKVFFKFLWFCLTGRMRFKELFLKVFNYAGNKPDETYAFEKWMLSYPPHISVAFRSVPDFSLEYWHELLDTWQAHARTINDIPYPCIDVIEKYITVIQGRRLTVNQPEQANNNIYMLGSSFAFGMYVLDSQTSSSVLQKYCEEFFPNRYKVINLGSAEGDIWTDFLKCSELTMNPSDYVILQITLTVFRKNADVHRNLIAKMDELCKRGNAKFVVLFVPELGRIVNPSQTESGLTYFSYYQMLNGAKPTGIENRLVKWVEHPLVTSLRSTFCFVEDLTIYFARPHDIGEVFINKTHLSPDAYEKIANIIFESYIKAGDSHFAYDDEKLVYHHIRYRIAQNYLTEGKTMLKTALNKYPTKRLLHEAFRLAYVLGDLTWVDKLKDIAEKTGNKVLADGYALQHNLSLGNIRDAIRELKSRNYPHFETLGRRHVRNMQDLNKRGGNVIILTYPEPAGEIQFSQFYPTIESKLSNCSVRFTCESRMYSLMQRAMPTLSFMPTDKPKQITSKTDISQYDELPSFSMAKYFDNNIWKEVHDSDSVAVIYDLLGDVIEGYESCNGNPYLFVDDALFTSMRERFKNQSKPLVGISWRSSVVDYNRFKFMFAIDEVMDLFAVDDIQFVCLQYDCRDWELERIESKHPGKLLHFLDVDQYNDFETTAALMKCMDLIITLPTTVHNLAGALGCPTWVFENNAMSSCLIDPKTGKLFWHNTIEIVRGVEVGNKASLLETLIKKIECWKHENKISQLNSR